MSDQNYMLDQLNSKNREAAKYRHRAKDFQTKYEEVLKQLEAANKKASDLQKQVDSLPAPSEEFEKVRQENETLKAEKRQAAHRAAFDKVAGELGIDASTREAAFTLSGYKAEGDPKEDALKDLLTKTLEANPFLVPQPKLEAGPGYTKGAAGDAGKKRVNFNDTQNQQWQLENPWFLDAHSKGEVEIVF